MPAESKGLKITQVYGTLHKRLRPFSARHEKKLQEPFYEMVSLVVVFYIEKVVFCEITTTINRAPELGVLPSFSLLRLLTIYYNYSNYPFRLNTPFLCHSTFPVSHMVIQKSHLSCSLPDLPFHPVLSLSSSSHSFSLLLTLTRKSYSTAVKLESLCSC